ncbi:MAG: hypothetical protein NVSMB64_23630 [Candidatus Velthaea sp.]
MAGHSWGGGYAMSYAASYPSHVKALLLLDSVGPDWQWLKVELRNSDANQTPAERTAFAYWSDKKNRVADPERANFEWLKALLPSFYYDRDTGERMNHALRLEDFSAKVADLMLSDLSKSYNVVPKLSGSNIPILILQGQNDVMGEETVAQLHSMLVNSKVQVVERSGHFPWTEQPQQFFADIEAYLSDIGGQSNLHSPTR